MSLRKRITTTIFSIVLLCLPTVVMLAQQPTTIFATEEDYTVKRFTIDDGMPSNAVNDLLLASDGYIWIGTFGGLVRFDGVKYEIFNSINTPNFTNNSILHIFEDSKQRIWIGTNGGGLMCYDDGDFRHYDTDSITGSSVVTAVIEHPDGSIWAGTSNGVIILRDGVVKKPRQEVLMTVDVYAMHFDRKGILWIGSKFDGLYRMTSDTLTHHLGGEGFEMKTIRCITSDNEGKVWIGTDLYVVWYEDGTFTHAPPSLGIPKGFINELAPQNDGRMLAATEYGVFRYSEGRFRKLINDIQLPREIIQTVMMDRENSIWLGTYRGGLVMMRQSKFHNILKFEGLPNAVINTIYEDNDRIFWIGTDFGLARLQGDQLQAYVLEGNASTNRIRDIYKDRQGRLWLATYHGLALFADGKVQKLYTTEDGLISNRIRRIKEGTDGDIWLATTSGISRMMSDGSIVNYHREHGLTNEFIMAMLFDSGGTLWIGTDGGGLFRMEGETFVPVAYNTTIVSDIIFNLFEDKLGRIWLSTNSGVALQQGEEFFPLGTSDRALTSSVYQTIEDKEGNFWLMSDRGVVSVNREILERHLRSPKGEPLTVKLYNRSDGMSSSQVTASSVSVLSTEGKVWTATLDGVTIIDPDFIPINKQPPPVLIEKFILDGNEVPLTETLVIPPGKHRLDFYYTGLSFYAPEKLRFRFKVDPFDQEWVEAGNSREASYTNLPPGEYSFWVRAANNDGIWNYDGASIKVVKEPYFYQTWYFYAFIVIVLITIGMLVSRIRLVQYQRRNKELAIMVQKRTQNIRKQKEDIEEQKEELKRLNGIKDKLLSIISHDLRGPINSFEGILMLLGSNALSEEETRHLVGKLGNDVGRIKDLLENLLNWAKSQMQGIHPKPVKLRLYNLVDDNINLMSSRMQQKELVVRNEVPESFLALADLDMVKLIIRNLLSNAVKFTKEGGEILFSATEEGQDVVLAVQDSGEGIATEDQQRLFDIATHYTKSGTQLEIGSGLGLLLCKEFALKNNGDIWVSDSSKEKGTTFKVRLPRG